ncbi:MAG: hypothetical protein JWM28_2722 [Chitinophagaceae bacterium]|nr:hypothetical protein [Chitinophagaceae bacterium]
MNSGQLRRINLLKLAAQFNAAEPLGMQNLHLSAQGTVSSIEYLASSDKLSNLPELLIVFKSGYFKNGSSS